VSANLLGNCRRLRGLHVDDDALQAIDDVRPLGRSAADRVEPANVLDRGSTVTSIDATTSPARPSRSTTNTWLILSAAVRTSRSREAGLRC
jgi:hypothetical protein